jgi:hypothetical protein
MPATTGKIYLGSTLVAGGQGAAPATTWTRPADWPALPAVAATDQVFRGLHAVFDHGSNFATIRCTGAFTVDWGDGSAPVNVASNTTALYNYIYAASGLGAVTSRGYKTAIVTVTPQAGQTLSVIDLGVKHTQAGLANNRSSGWLDIRLAMNNAGTVTTYASDTWVHRYLEQFEWVGGSTTQTNYTSFLRAASSLQKLHLFNTAAGQLFAGFVQDCFLLPELPLFNTANGTSFSAFGVNTRSMREAPLLNTGNGTNFSSFWSGSGIVRAPLYNTALGTIFSNFFFNCTNLQKVEPMNLAAATNVSGCLQSDPALQEVPTFVLSAATNLTNFAVNSPCISRIRATFPAGQNINLASLSLGPAALDEIYTNLPTASGSPRTITVTGNWGTAAHTPTIATSKGWTVTA